MTKNFCDGIKWRTSYLRLPMKVRLCKQCGSKLRRQKGELRATFGRRKYCDARCRNQGPWKEAA